MRATTRQATAFTRGVLPRQYLPGMYRARSDKYEYNLVKVTDFSSVFIVQERMNRQQTNTFSEEENEMPIEYVRENEALYDFGDKRYSDNLIHPKTSFSLSAIFTFFFI